MLDFIFVVHCIRWSNFDLPQLLWIIFILNHISWNKLKSIAHNIINPYQCYPLMPFYGRAFSGIHFIMQSVWWHIGWYIGLPINMYLVHFSLLTLIHDLSNYILLLRQFTFIYYRRRHYVCGHRHDVGLALVTQSSVCVFMLKDRSYKTNSGVIYNSIFFTLRDIIHKLKKIVLAELCLFVKKKMTWQYWWPLRLDLSLVKGFHLSPQ